MNEKLKTVDDLGFVRKDVNIRVINEPELKAEAIKRVKEDMISRDQAQKAGRGYVEEYYNGKIIVMMDFHNITEHDLTLKGGKEDGKN